MMDTNTTCIYIAALCFPCSSITVICSLASYCSVTAHYHYWENISGANELLCKYYIGAVSCSDYFGIVPIINPLNQLSGQHKTGNSL